MSRMFNRSIVCLNYFLTILTYFVTHPHLSLDDTMQFCICTVTLRKGRNSWFSPECQLARPCLCEQSSLQS